MYVVLITGALSKRKEGVMAAALLARNL